MLTSQQKSQFSDPELKKQLSQLRVQILEGKPLSITSKHSKDTNILSTAYYTGIVEYYPEELVITARAGTPIKAVQAELDKHNQTLLFTSDKKTIGGAYAYGSKALRDSVLGVKIIDGQGQLLNFGGQVMKNVAGYDVARLLVGAQGKMALIIQVSFKVLPKNSANLIESPKPKSTQNKKSNEFTQDISTGLARIFDPKNIFC